MASPGSMDWLWYVLGGVLALGALVLLARTIIGDRSKGRRRCPKCWYELGAIATLTCPECGRAAKSEKHLLKTRRRLWQPPAAAALLLAGAAAAARPTVRDQGWPGIIPNRVLIWMTPWMRRPTFVELEAKQKNGKDYPPSVQLWRELTRRGAAGQLSPSEVIAFIKSANDDAIRLQMLDQVALGDDGYEAAHEQFIQSRARAALGLRSKWPVGVSLRAKWNGYWAPGADTGRMVTCSTSLPDARPLRHYIPPLDLTSHSTPSSVWHDATKELAAPPPLGVHTIEFTAAVFENSDVGRSEQDALWLHSFTRTLEVVPTIDDAIQPIRSERLDLLLRGRLQLRLFGDARDSTSRFELSFGQLRSSSYQVLDDRSLDGIAIGLHFEFRRKDRPIGSYRCYVDDDDHMYLDRPIAGDISPFFDASVPAAELTVLVQGEGSLALLDFEREKYWAGRIMLSCEEVSCTVLPRSGVLTEIVHP